MIKTNSELDTLSSDELWDMSKRLTLREAATCLNMGQTKLKKVCRLHGMQFWPHRLFQSYFKMLQTPIFTADDKHKLKTIIDLAARHKFAFNEEQKNIINKARQKAYKYKFKLATRDDMKMI